MEKYKISCTQEQAQKALQLGAPIEVTEYLSKLVNNNYVINDDKATAMIIPTAEEMIGWLEEQSITEISIMKCSFVSDFWGFGIFSEHEGCIAENTKDFNSRKKATLAAIDAALKYLSNKK